MTMREGYAIRGGIEGRERLRVLSRVLRPSTTSLLESLGLDSGMTCLDVGCGGGDVTADMARRVAPGGRATGVDLDETKLDLARREAEAGGIHNIEFRTLDIRTQRCGSGFDLVYARFLLTHLRDPDSTVRSLVDHLRPGGVLAIEDIDFSGGFTWPESRAFRRFSELYCAVVHERGGDPDIGRRLPVLLAASGLDEIGLNVIQPIGTEGDVKLINPLTMESIADSVLADGLASATEIDAIARELYRIAADRGTVAGLPRIVQTWGRRPTP